LLVPEEKIRPRYQRLWDRVCQAMVAADATHVYDSSPHTRPLIVAQLTSGIRGAVHLPGSNGTVAAPPAGMRTASP
jgi:predicted ABC-type ATPase